MNKSATKTQKAQLLHDKLEQFVNTVLVELDELHGELKGVGEIDDPFDKRRAATVIFGSIIQVEQDYGDGEKRGCTMH